MKMDMEDNFRKIRLLLWKNILVQRRHKIQTIVEFLLPIVMSMVLILLRSWVKTNEAGDVYFDAFTIQDNCSIPYHPKGWKIAWSPSTSHNVASIMNALTERTAAQGISFANETEMENKLSAENAMNDVLAGICFNEVYDSDDKLLKDIKIKIRFPGQSRYPSPNTTTLDTQVPNWRTHLIFPLYPNFGPRDVDVPTGGEPGYCEEGFLALQNELFDLLSDEMGIASPSITLQRFPYPKYSSDRLLPALSTTLAIFVLLGFIYCAISSIRLVTFEKELQMKVGMRLMGLPNWMHWTAWYIKEVLQWTLPCIFLTIALTCGWQGARIFPKTDPFLLFFILFIYSCASVSFCFLVSVCFNRANSAAAVGGALWLLTYSIHLILQSRYASMTRTQLLITGLFSNTNMAYIFQLLISSEGTEIGLQWNNLFDLISLTDKISIGGYVAMLAFNAVFYMCLAIYIESVFPGKYGIRRPWHFPLQKSYWFGKKSHDHDIRCAKGIQIRQLTKVYSSEKLAVNKLTLDMYPNQITVLLGHNGAGKSSTMSMLTGMIKPTSGTAVIDGKDIWDGMSNIRNGLGICPQYNLLFPELTIVEHLNFFGMIKGIHGDYLESEVKRYVSILELEAKKDDQAWTLSGGYKRKLSVAIALIGHSKVVLLDEPTSGMDPVARRCLWDVLQAERHGRTMVLSTHLMDEADLLGDRVAILKGGELMCVGTPFMLKQQYGHGYTVTLVKNNNNDYRDDKIVAFVQSFYPNAYFTSSTETEMQFKLKDASSMPDLLTTLTREQEGLGIKEHGVSVTTMEDVYQSVNVQPVIKPLGLTESNGSSKICLLSNIIMDSEVKLPSSIRTALQYRSESNTRYWLLQLKAMIIKKCIISRRSIFFHALQVLMTVVFIALAYMVKKSWQAHTDLPPLDMSLSPVPGATSILFNDTNEEYLESLVSAAINVSDIEILENNEQLDKFILHKYYENRYDASQKYMAAVKWTPEEEYFGYFNDQPYHILPAVVNLIQNAFLKNYNTTTHTFTVVNHPFPFTPTEQAMAARGGSNLGFQVAFNLSFCNAFICAIFLLMAVKESGNGAKHLQFASGVNPVAYWCGSIIWDYAMSLLPIWTIITSLYIIQDPSYSEIEQLTQVLCLSMAFYWAAIPLMGLFSYFFVDATLAFVIISLINLLVGCSLITLVIILQVRPLLLIDEAKSIEDFAIYIPAFSFANGLRNIYLSYDMKYVCEVDPSSKLCDGWDGDHYSWKQPGIGRNLTLLFFTGLLFNILLVSMDCIISGYKYIKKNHQHRMFSQRFATGIENELKVTNPSKKYDEDISEVKTLEKVPNLVNRITISNVWKDYHGVKFAVKGLNLTVKSYECFALLGSNGAGKTTTFKMLTMETSVSYGSISICSMDTERDRKMVSKMIGYCPQFDALINQLTGRETLHMFCTLRGIPRADQPLVVSHLSHKLMFHKYLDVIVGKYSGGNKRKLSTAVALIGDPPVVLLDEPTSGMDPEARRHLWNTINHERERGKCILITTHCLEECEALCTRLAIMVEGELRCVGSIQQLKNKYAAGFKAHVKFPASTQQNVKWFMSSSLPGSEIFEEYEGMILYQISNEISCLKVFTVMEKAKADGLIENYAIQQTSLEQVFLQIAR